ncbi:YceD family protein, partial [Vibrio parahaemolyticus]
RAAAGVIDAKGELRARVTLTDVDTLEPFESEVTEDFALRFVPEDAETHEIDIEAPDEIPYADDRLDLGEAAAEQLALALPPYPRRAG